MKKLLITLEYPPFKGGVATYLEALVSQWKPEDVIVLADRSKNSFMYDSAQLHTIIRRKLLGGVIFKWLFAYKEARELMRASHIDHVVVSHILPMGYIAMLLGKPYTVILHGMDILLAQKNPIKAFLTKKILDKASYVLANSQFTKQEVLRVDPNLRVIVAYPCPAQKIRELARTPQSRYKDLNRFTCLSVNRLVARKGNDTMIDAIALLKDRGVSDIRYSIVGKGPYREVLNKKITHYNLSDQVVIYTDISDEDLHAWYSSVDVLCMPARRENQYDVEGFGIVFLEAALYGLPAIAGESGGMREAVIEGVTGVIVDSSDSEDVADALYYLYTHREEVSRMGKRAQERVRTEFTWEAQFSSYITLLESHES